MKFNLAYAYIFTVFPLIVAGVNLKLALCGKTEIDSKQYTTTSVEFPNNGHIGSMAFVRCREMSASRRLLNYYMYGEFIHPVSRGLSAFRSVRFGRLYCMSNYTNNSRRGDYSRVDYYLWYGAVKTLHNASKGGGGGGGGANSDNPIPFVYKMSKSVT